MAELWDVQSDEIMTDYDEEQALLNDLFHTKFNLSLDMIKGVMACGHLTFEQLLKRYKEPLSQWVDQEAQDVLRVLQDGAYLQEVWSWISDTDQYKQWVHIYLENKVQLEEIAEYYHTHPDFNYDLETSALEAKNELFLAQTQPGDPVNFDMDYYTEVEQWPETDFISVSVPGDGDYDRFLLEEDEELFDDRGVTSTSISDAEDKELKPVNYIALRHSDVGRQIAAIRRTAIEYRKQNFIRRRDWKKLNLLRKPEYLDEEGLQALLKENHQEELDAIAQGLSDLSHEGEVAQDLLLLLIDGTYIDFVSYDVKLQSDGCSVGTLADFGALFADEVMDFAQPLQDPSGWHQYGDPYYARLLRDYVTPILYDDATALIEQNPAQSTLFNEVVLEHILSGASIKDAYKQAYHACKLASSPEGETAYRRAVNSGMSYGQAMHQFYETAHKAGDLARPRDKVVAVHPDKMVVLTASSQFTKEREINWSIARMKANNQELFVPADAPSQFKQQVFGAIKSLKWHPGLIAKLKE